MAKYQIRFCDKDGHGSFKYFDTGCEVVSVENIEKMAAEEATNYIENRLIRGFDSWKPPKKLDVWEWNTEKKEVKKKGHRFKLQLMHVQATYESGRKVRNEWYEPIEK